MAARDRYTIPILCPQCNRPGSKEARISEDDHPYMRDPGLSIDELPPGFTTPNSYPVYHAAAEIRCGTCGCLFSLFPKWHENWSKLFR